MLRKISGRTLIATVCLGVVAALLVIAMRQNSAPSALLQNGPAFWYQRRMNPMAFRNQFAARVPYFKPSFQHRMAHLALETEESPLEEAPAEEVPAEEGPAEEAPFEGAPVEEDESAFPPGDVPESVDEAPVETPAVEAPEEKKEAEKAPEQVVYSDVDPLGDNVVDVSKLEKFDEGVEPDNLLGDEVIDLPRHSQGNDLGDFFVGKKDIENNKYMFKQNGGAKTSVLYNAPDTFNVASHKPPCKYVCKEDPWGPGCDGHPALSNGDCEEVIDLGGDRVIPVEKIAPATYDSFSGNTHGLFKAQQAQALLARAGPRRAAGRRVARRQGLWLGDNWYIEGLKPDGDYMTGADAEAKEGNANSLFDFGRADGTPVNPETGMVAPGMTQFYKPGDGDRPGLFDVKAIRANEDGGLPQSWYDMNEPQGNFRSKGRGKWAPGRSPKVMVFDGRVEYIDDGMPYH